MDIYIEHFVKKEIRRLTKIFERIDSDTPLSQSQLFYINELLTDRYNDLLDELVDNYTYDKDNIEK